MISDVIIIGSGPAGYTAAIYAARANFKVLMISGRQEGGQLTLTTEVENFPGFPKGINGLQLVTNMKKQAEKFGVEIKAGEAKEVDFKQPPFTVKTDSDEFSGRSIIIATGASARWLGLESERRLLGKGVSGCATCDGFFYKDKEVVVVGGGDTAMEEANFLTRFAARVRLIHRRGEFRASAIMVERARQNSKIEFILDSVVEEILGSDKVSGVKVKNVKSGEVSELKCDGVFMAIGHKPNTDFLRGQLAIDDKGYIKVEPGNVRTGALGVFACGDVIDSRYRQAITAAGLGCMAAKEAEWYLEENKN